MKQQIKENKIWTGMKTFKKRNLPKGSLSYIREQIERKVPSSLNEQTTTHQHLEK